MDCPLLFINKQATQPVHNTLTFNVLNYDEKEHDCMEYGPKNCNIDHPPCTLLFQNLESLITIDLSIKPPQK